MPELTDRASARGQDASDHHKISFTAKLVALGRAATEIPFARDVSELVGAPALGEALARAAGMRQKMISVISPLVEARYFSLGSAIKKSGARQVLELASGVSLRGLAMALESPALTYVETDLPDLTAEKREIMGTIFARRNLGEVPNHHVRAANVLAWPELEAVLEPLTPDEPVAVVHEGLFMYLTRAEKEVAARHIRRILDRFGGVWITPDFGPISSLTLPLAAEELGRAKAVIEERTGRSFEAHAFRSEQEARNFCEGLGFTVEERPQLDGSYELSSLAAGQAPELVTRMRQELKLWEMRRPRS